MTRWSGPVGLLLLGVLALGCQATPERADPPTTAGTTSRPTPASHGRCHGVSFGQVRGPAPAYVRGPLADFAAQDAVCAAYWLRSAGQWFVPQSLEIDGTTAYVAGYRWHPRRGNRPCQIAVVDTRSGRITAFVKRWEAPVYGPEPTYCRHAGGMEMTAAGLLVEETERLWLLDPDRFGKGDPVRRVWRLPGFVRGSTLVASGHELGIGTYRVKRPGPVWWFRLGDVMAPGVSRLDAPVRRTQAPALLQGLGRGPGGVWFSSSSSRCGALRGPGRRSLAFVPGAEDFEFRGQDVWVVSEASARPFLGSDERPVPLLLRLDVSQVLSGRRGGCSRSH